MMRLQITPKAAFALLFPESPTVGTVCEAPKVTTIDFAPDGAAHALKIQLDRYGQWSATIEVPEAA